MAIITLAKDLTYIKEKESLKKSLGEIIETSWNEVFIFDRNTLNFTYANKEALKNTGYSLKELKSITPVDIKPDFSEEKFKGLIEPLLNREKNRVVFDTVHQRKDGSVYDAEIRLTLGVFEGKEVFVAIIQDITKRKKYERELVETYEKEKSTILDNINEVVMLMSPDLRIIWANRAASEKSGVPADQMIGRYCSDVWHNKRWSCEECPLLKVKNTETAHTREITGTDGRSWLITAVPLKDNDGKLTGIVETSLEITERKEYEKKLFDKKQRLEEKDKIQSLTIESMDNGFIFFGEDNKILLANSILYEMFDLSETAKNITEGNVFRDLLKDKIENFEEFKKITTCNFASDERSIDLFKLKNGKIFERYSVPVFNEDKKIGRICNFRDVTVEKSFNAEIIRSREQFELAVNGSQDGIWDWDIANDELFLSPRWKEIIGYEDWELENKFSTFEEHIHPDDKQRVMDTVNKYFNNKLPAYCQEFRFRHKNGSYVWILARGEALRDENENPYRMAGSHTDITERKMNEERLKQKDKLLSAVAKATTELLMHHEDLYMAMSKAFKTIGQAFEVDRIYLFENSYDEQQNKQLTSQRVEWCADCTDPQIDNPELQDVPYDIIPEFTNTLFNNKPLIKHVKDMEPQTKAILEPQDIISILVLPININGELWGFIGFDECKKEREWTAIEKATFYSFAAITTGVIENNLKGKELLSEKQRAEAANKAKSEFLANMSHEIRTPMNGVIGFIDLLSHTELDEEQKDFINEVKKSSEQLLTVINDILDLSKIEAGKIYLENTGFDVHSLIEDVALLTKSSLMNKEIEVNSLIYSNVPRKVIGDAAKLKQILNNLTNNAVKFTDYGEITITAKSIEEDNEHAIVSFIVRDTGIGIPEEKLESIFESFSQADSSSTRKYSGTGLGLSISKNLAGLMGGSLNIESKEGEGSVFSLTARFKRDKNLETKEKTTDLKILENKNTLIVDDNKTNIKVLKYYLEEAGCNVFDFAYASEAYEFLKNQEKIDIGIIDHKLQGEDGGLFLAEKIKTCEKIKNFPLILLTSYVKTDVAREAKQYGFSGYLTKPVKKGNLLESLVQAIEGSKSLDAAENPSLITKQSIRENRFNCRYKILLAEDNEINQKLTVKVLNKAGYNCDIAVNGVEALDAFKNKSYDLILMDCQMPVMDGYEATREIRNMENAENIVNKKTKSIPIIALTAHAIKGDREKCLLCGMNDYVSKPIDAQELAGKIEKYLSAETGEDEENFHTKQTIQEISKYTGLSTEDAEELLNEYMEKLPSMLAEISMAIEEEDFLKIKTLAHTVKGSSSNLRLNEIKTMAMELERAAFREKISLCREILCSIEEFADNTY